MTGRVLAVLIGGRTAATIVAGNGGRFSLTYDPAWQDAADATPLSVSMPLTRQRHDDAPVRAFLWGLLPDNDRVLERWAQTYQVSARNPFALLWHVGEDCAGAAQFVPSDRVDAVLRGDGGVNWLTRGDVAERLRVLRSDPTAWHVHDTGQFSLAGAQAKTALHYDAVTDRWGEPWGSTPTTHILKPAVAGLDDHDLNEHLCLRAAAMLGVTAAESEVSSFNDERVIVVERYDRLYAKDGSITRIHQEDMCQALGIVPTVKYQSDGGPSAEQIIALLRSIVFPAGAAAESVARFFDALSLNWIIGGTDAHAKNYSILLSGQQVRLAPLYDVASALAYDGMHVPKLRMAMKIGGRYGLEEVSGRHWRRLAVSSGLSPDAVVARIHDLAMAAPDAFAKVAREPGVAALGGELPGRLMDRVAARSLTCLRALAQ